MYADVIDIANTWLPTKEVYFSSFKYGIEIGIEIIVGAPPSRWRFQMPNLAGTHHGSPPQFSLIILLQMCHFYEYFYERVFQESSMVRSGLLDDLSPCFFQKVYRSSVCSLWEKIISIYHTVRYLPIVEESRVL